MKKLAMDEVDAVLGQLQDRLEKLETRMSRQYDETEQLLRRIEVLERELKNKGRKGFYAGRS